MEIRHRIRCPVEKRAARKASGNTRGVCPCMSNTTSSNSTAFSRATFLVDSESVEVFVDSTEFNRMVPSKSQVLAALTISQPANKCIVRKIHNCIVRNTFDSALSNDFPLTSTAIQPVSSHATMKTGRPVALGHQNLRIQSTNCKFSHSNCKT